MIRRETIDGRGAMVSYLTAAFEPASEEEAEIIKILFDDGEMMILTPDEEEQDLDDELAELDSVFPSG